MTRYGIYSDLNGRPDRLLEEVTSGVDLPERLNAHDGAKWLLTVDVAGYMLPPAYVQAGLVVDEVFGIAP